jgi:biopolymer transport protein TolQ
VLPAVVTIQTQKQVVEFDIVEILAKTDGLVLVVLIVLGVMLLGCCLIGFYKWFWFFERRSSTKRFWAEYEAASQPNDLFEMTQAELKCAESRVLVAGYNELSRVHNTTGGDSTHCGFENIERAVNRSQAAEVARMERWLPFLATTGSTAPFIGLFGTVWGIMGAIFGLGAGNEGSDRLRSVMPDIAEALVATAIGLVVAIPSVMAYNYFVNKIRSEATALEGFGSDYLNTLRRFFYSK